jgi:hypothetical protein
MALGHARKGGATVFGLAAGKRVSPEWAAWANGTAVRELDMHDTFLAADYAHPGDNIPPILAVAQAMERSGRDLLRGLATGYEIQIDLVRAISLHEFNLPGHPAGRARQLLNPPVPQRRNQQLEGLRPGPRRQARRRSRRPRDARRRRAKPDL